MLFQNQVPFDSLPKTIVKSIVMMIGEYEYEVKFQGFPKFFSILFHFDYKNFKGMFGAFIEDYCGDLDPNTNECTEWNEINFFNDVAYVMFIAFMVVMTIIISNMLIGLAVDDIKEGFNNLKTVLFCFCKIENFGHIALCTKYSKKVVSYFTIKIFSSKSINI
jgi:hypothetical protein